MNRRGRPAIRAAVALLAVGAVVFGASVVRADPTPSLPAVSPQQLLASTLSALSSPYTISGDVSTKLDLGLPDLPSGMGGPVGPLPLAIGTQHFKLWHAPGGLRIAHLLDFREQDLIANTHDAWFWDSNGMTAVHLTVPAGASGPPSSPIAGADLDSTARRLLSIVSPYADVSVDGTGRVADRPVYELTLTPTTPLTKIGRVVAAIDAQSHLPLGLYVFPRSEQTSAIEAAFTTVSYDAIDPSIFTFAPPPGATVHDAGHVPDGGWQAKGPQPMEPSPNDVRVFGYGFDLRYAYRLDRPLPGNVSALLPYSGPLLSAIEVQRGGARWILFGFVGVDTLERDAGSLP